MQGDHVHVRSFQRRTSFFLHALFQLSRKHIISSLLLFSFSFLSVNSNPSLSLARPRFFHFYLIYTSKCIFLRIFFPRTQVSTSFIGTLSTDGHYAWLSIARIIREPTRNYVSKCLGAAIMHGALRATRSGRRRKLLSWNVAFHSIRYPVYVSFASRKKGGEEKAEKNQERIRYLRKEMSYPSLWVIFSEWKVVFFSNHPYRWFVLEAVSRNCKID